MTMSDFRRKKLLSVFDSFFDTNGSGSIDKKDFEMAAERFFRVKGWSDEDPKAVELRKRFLDVWDALLSHADSDNDAEVSKGEWCSMWLEYAQGNTKPQDWQEKYMGLIFDLHDTSGDGSVGEDEFVAVNTLYGVSKDECSKAFHKLTTDNSVVLTKDVFAKLWKEFFTSDDASAPGTHLFGKLSY